MKRRRSPSNLPRQVSVASKGHWLQDRRHTRIDTLKGVSPELITYSPEFKYHYLRPYEALFCLESNQLAIYFNELPLSLAEAYHLLLGDNEKRFREYRVFQNLNRIGFICLPPSLADTYTFDVYKRETFKLKKPDHYLRILDGEQSKIYYDQLDHEGAASGKLMFALIDIDFNINFSQFKSLQLAALDKA